MIRTLKIKNFALIEDLTVNFDSGLSIISGETGAGKSMIVQAIAILGGERIDNFVVRGGKKFAEITGVFTTAKPIQERLKEAGVELDDELIIRRRVEVKKRQNSYINDRLVSLNLLKELSSELIDLVGQYENQSLFYSKTHLALLDSYAGIDDLKRQYTQHYHEYLNLQKKLEDLISMMRQKDERLDYIKFQIEEIDKANLKSGEEELLKKEKELLLSSERRISLTNEIINILYEADGAVVENLAKGEKLFTELTSHDPSLKDLQSQISVALSTVDDIARELSSYRQRIEFSGERLDFVLERLDTLNRIKKKYGRTIEEVDEYLIKLKHEYKSIESKDEEIGKIRSQLKEVEKEVKKEAKEISIRRCHAAKNLEVKILELLTQLGMQKAQFQIQITQRELCETGADEVEFYISTNPGEQLKPLRRIASGGEISRITLCLKTILSDVDRIPTVVFDEVDTGIGGGVAEAVGNLLALVGKRHQILCVTHLPQISVFADHHYLVKKKFRNNRTFSEIVKLTEPQRKFEIARMLGGKEITKKTIEHAEEFLRKMHK